MPIYMSSWTWLTLFVLPYVVFGLHAEVSFSRSQSNTSIYKRLPGISIELCEMECNSRRRCQQAIYDRAAKVCSLTQDTDSTEGIVQKGHVLLHRFHTSHTIDPICGETVCSFQETCAKENGQFVCKFTECSKLDSDYYTVFGNMNDVNSRLLAKYTSSGKQVQITCNETGRWIGEIFEDCCYVGCFSGVTSTSVMVGYVGITMAYYCDMDTDGGHWMVFQRRKDGSENFFRNWIDYENGFGSLDGEFWLGLDNMRSILSTGEFELQIDLESFEGERRYAKYSSFSIGPASDNYRLHVSGYSGDAGDSFSFHNGIVFSTWENDNDNLVWGNCGIDYRSGWWFKSCFRCNLNGEYYHGGERTPLQAKNIIWSTWLGSWYSLKTTEMKFRKLP